jgi:hypothetical protein
MIDQKEFDAYLAQLDIPVEEKRYASSFLKKNSYLNQIQQMGIMSKNSPEVLEMGFGNFNTKIMIVVANPSEKKIVLKFLTPLLERINISIWNCYLTFYQKCSNTNVCDELFEREKQCIKPEVIIRFNNSETNYDDIKNITINMDDVKYVLNGDNFQTEEYISIMKGVYAFIPKLIPFKELELSH